MFIGMLFVAIVVFFIAATEMFSFRFDKTAENLLYVQEAESAPEASEVLTTQKPSMSNNMSTPESNSTTEDVDIDDFDFSSMSDFVVSADEMEDLTEETAGMMTVSLSNNERSLSIKKQAEVENLAEVDNVVEDFFGAIFDEGR